MQPKRPGRCYLALRVLFRSILAMTMRIGRAGLEHEPKEGAYLLVVCHLDHLDPVIMSTIMQRRIGWMSRIEFYRNRFMRAFLQFTGAFPVNRQGYARPALREALKRLQDGEAVGLFPEGEIMSGQDTVLRQGRVRGGAAWLAARAGCPVLPVVILGTNKLCSLSPWLPAWRGRLWLTAGPLLTAPADAKTRAGRAAFTAQLEAEFRRLAQETLKRHGLPESVIP
jgi:1-acyl-sn-glycerol-3-phosphate acyltransferase